MEINADTQSRVNDLLVKARGYEQHMVSLLDYVNAYNAARDSWMDLRSQIVKELSALGNHVNVELPCGKLEVKKMPDQFMNGQYGVNQLRDKIVQMKAEAVKMLVDGKTPSVNPNDCDIALSVNVKAGIALREEKKKEKKEPEFVFTPGYNQPLTKPTTSPRIVVEVPRATSIPGIYHYDYSNVKKLEGRLVKMRYRKLFDGKIDNKVKIRDGKDHEEVVGWVEKDWGVWQTQEGNFCIRLRNYNRVVDTNLGMTPEEAEELHKLGQLAHGEYAFRTYRLEGIVPGTFEFRYGNEWKIVDVAQ